MSARAVTANAPGKVILFGEHAVVYGQPAIAVPVHQVQASALIEPAESEAGFTLVADDLNQVIQLTGAPESDPLAATVRLTLHHLSASPPDATLTIWSTIPIASGLGSGAAVSTAIVRALAAYLGRELAPGIVSDLVLEIEKLHHGTPSGIDNTVVAYAKPVFFVQGQAPQTFGVGTSLNLVIADTGAPSPTRVAVAHVRQGWERDRHRYERLFGQIGGIAREARVLIGLGDCATSLGKLMTRNQKLLCELGVSSAGLDRLVGAAHEAGALGAKLSGAGRGGNVIALVSPAAEEDVAKAIRAAGALRVITTVVPARVAPCDARGTSRL
jgi:mevalonate kinase